MCDTPSPWETKSSSETYEYKGKTFSIPNIEYSVCRECGYDVVLPRQQRQSDALVRDARREIDGLLTGQEIKTIREDLGLTQTAAAHLLGGGPNAFSKYERGEVTQSLAMDRLLRLLFEFRVPAGYEFEFELGAASKRLVGRERLVQPVTVTVAVVGADDDHIPLRRHQIETVQALPASDEAADQSNAWALLAA